MSYSTWAKKQFSKNQVNAAGEILRKENPSTEDLDWATNVLTNWRSLHAYPINTFQALLRKKLKAIDKDAFVAQRLKRAPSIIGKLKIYDSMKLSRMQDIGGIRAVVSNVEKVRELEKAYRDNRFQHEHVGGKDYIIEPKPTGYRGIHLIYKYKSKIAPDYDGLHVELQIRTKLQHTWATAVETMGTFLNHSLKSSQGPDEWLEYFALTGSAFAHLEKCQPVPGFESFSVPEIYSQTIEVTETLRVKDRLKAFSIAANSISNDKKGGSYHLVTLNIGKQMVTIKSFGLKRLDEANQEYAEIERKILEGEPLQVVLVSTGTIDSLKNAYPNYFLDTHDFIKKIDLIGRLARKMNRKLT